MRHHQIELDHESCTSCDICVRECPTWCITLVSHQETVTEPGSRPKTVNVLDDFKIDWALCMYCGICIEECPFDALSWSERLVPTAASLAEMVRQL